MSRFQSSPQSSDRSHARSSDSTLAVGCRWASPRRQPEGIVMNAAVAAWGVSTPTLDPAAQAFADATSEPPFLFDLPPAEGRKAVDDVQSRPISKPDVDLEDVIV